MADMIDMQEARYLHEAKLGCDLAEVEFRLRMAHFDRLKRETLIRYGIQEHDTLDLPSGKIVRNPAPVPKSIVDAPAETNGAPAMAG